MKRTFLTLAAGAAAAAAVAGSTTARADSWRVDAMLASNVCHETGATTGDWEVAFGIRVIRRKAQAFLSQVRRRGFTRALIEREQCLYEVSIIHLSLARAQTIAARARKKGFRVSVVRS